MQKPGPIALRAAADAEKNIGVHETGGENEGPAIATYLASVGIGSPAPWCAAFCFYRLKAAARELGLPWPQMGYPKSGYCPDVKNWAKAHGFWIPVGSHPPMRGDLCLFYFGAKGRVAHIGIVVDPSNGHDFYTVEGNTSDDSGVDREGDGVFRKHRTSRQLGDFGGFVRVPV